MPLSYSQLSTYRRCPRQYEFQVIKKIPRGISEAESFGSSVHNALKKFGELEIKSHEPRATSQLEMFQEAGGTATQRPDSSCLTPDTLRQLWHESFIFDTYATRVEADFARQRGEQLLEQFYEWWSQEERSVLAVEQSFKIPIDGVLLSGRMDRIEGIGGGVRVVDFKTSSPRGQEEVDADLQLSIYALAVQELYEVPCAELVLLYVSENGVVERKTQRSAGQLADARKQIAHLKERMDGRDFHPTPGVNVCRCCPYRGVCDVAAIAPTPVPSPVTGEG